MAFCKWYFLYCTASSQKRIRTCRNFVMVYTMASLNNGTHNCNGMQYSTPACSALQLLLYFTMKQVKRREQENVISQDQRAKKKNNGNNNETCQNNTGMQAKSQLRFNESYYKKKIILSCMSVTGQRCGPRCY